MNWDIFHFSWKQHLFIAESEVTRLTTRFFLVSNICDVVIGLLQYPSQVSDFGIYSVYSSQALIRAHQLFVLTTWVHHGAYILLCCWMLKSR